MNLEALRQDIDRIDNQIVDLYLQRMETARKIGQYKRENGIAVQDPSREQQLLDRVAARAGADAADDIRALFTLLMAQSRARQKA